MLVVLSAVAVGATFVGNRIRADAAVRRVAAELSGRGFYITFTTRELDWIDSVLYRFGLVGGSVPIEVASGSVTDVGSEDTQHLIRLASLRQIDFSNTNAGDEDVAGLTSIPALEEVLLFHTRVSDRAVARMRQERPNVIVRWTRQRESSPPQSSNRVPDNNTVLEWQD